MAMGLFIVLEGFDFSGKTKQQEMLSSWFKKQNKYNDILSTQEPTRKAEEIIRILKEETDPNSVNCSKMAQGYINDRIQHSENLILPSLNAGAIVICDRYRMSTDAYQWAQGIPLQKLLDMQNHSSIIQPDLTILFDIDVETFLKRAKRAKKYHGRGEELFEKREFAKIAIENYRTLANSEYGDNPERYGEIVVIDGKPKEDVVHTNVIDAVDPIYDLWCDYNK